MQRPIGLTVIAVLGLAQGVLGVLRAAQWVQIGSDLLGRGLLVVPVVGAVAILRGTLVAGLGLLYVLFAWGAFARRGWAGGLGLAAALLNGLAVVSLVFQEGVFLGALFWAIVPLAVICYLLAPAGRRALGR